jgi:hypothetical protein
MDEEGTLVRIDRVGLFTRSGLEGKLPLIFAEYGDLWLKNDGKIGYFKTAWYGKNWQSTLSDVRDVREVNRLTALSDRPT